MTPLKAIQDLEPNTKLYITAGEIQQIVERAKLEVQVGEMLGGGDE